MIQTAEHQDNKLLDIFKFLAAIFILASHCLPLVPNMRINFLYGQWFFRFCVPLFLISAGYFFASFQKSDKIKYIKRIIVLYIIASALYLPAYIKAEPKTILQNLVFGYHHLWYLSALIVSLCLYLALESFPSIKKVFTKLYPYLTVILIIIGAYFDEYRLVFSGISNIPVVKFISLHIKYIGGSRHALFFALPMLWIGRFIYEHKSVLTRLKTSYIWFTILSFTISLTECLLLQHFCGDKITCDITLFNYLPAVFLFMLTLVYQPKVIERFSTKTIRKTADIVYVLHIFVLSIVKRLISVTYMLRFVAVLVISLTLSYLCLKILKFLKASLKRTK